VVLSQETSGEIMEEIINIQREEPEREDLQQQHSVPKPTEPEAENPTDKPEEPAGGRRDSTPPPAREGDKEEWSI